MYNEEDRERNNLTPDTDTETTADNTAESASDDTTEINLDSADTGAGDGEYHYTYASGQNPGNYYSGSNTDQSATEQSQTSQSQPNQSQSETYAGSQNAGGQYTGNAYNGSAYNNGSYNNGAGDGAYYYNNSYYNGQGSGGYNQVPPKKPKKEHRKAPKWARFVAAAVAFGLIAGVVFQGVNAITKKIFPSSSVTSTTSAAKISTTSAVTDDTASNTTNQTDIEAVVTNCMPSIVSITNMSVSEVQSFFGGTQQQQSESVGSGIIIGENDTELLIVTNNHVISDAQTLTVSFVDNSSVSAQVKGANSDSDIAVVAVKLSDISSTTLSSIKIATLGDSSTLQVGETAIAIGNALGYGQSVTSGIISALNRTLSDSDITCALIQTDAAINPGNSGGALLNSKGEVVGINTAKVSSTDVESMGYAIPISDVEDIINDLMNQTTREKVATSEQGALGIKCVDISSTMAQSYNMPTGIYVSELVSGGAAEAAGIEKGDVITGFDGSSITTTDALKSKLQYYKAGETVSVTIQRVTKAGEYAEQTIQVTLQTSTSSSSSSSGSSSSGSSSSGSSSSGGYSSGGSTGSGSSGTSVFGQ